MPTLKLKEEPFPIADFENYARALRAIGQDLSALYPDDLEIRVTDSEFTALGVGLDKGPVDQPSNPNIVQRTWHRLTGYEPGILLPPATPYREPFLRKYNVDEINRLDDLGQASRGKKSGKPDIYSLGERLRTVGRIVDACGGTLIRIVKCRNSMRFEYRDQNGREQTEEYTNLALYKYQQRYYAERGTYIFIDPWDSKID